MRVPDLVPELDGLGLPDDLTEVALADLPSPDSETAGRIKARTLGLVLSETEYHSVPSTPLTVNALDLRRSVRRRWIAAAAAIVLLLASTLPPVTAAVRQIIAFVPGFGVRDTASFRLAAGQAVEVQRGRTTVTLYGIVADDQYTTVGIAVSGTVQLEGTILEDNAGRRYISAGGYWTQAGGAEDGSMQGLLSFKPPLPADTREVTLIIPGSPDWRLTVPLVPATDLTSIEQFGSTVTVSGVTMAARAQCIDSRTDVTVFMQGLPDGMAIADLGRLSTGVSAEARPELILPDGERVSLRTTYASYTGLRALSADSVNEDQVTVCIPALSLTKPVTARVRVPIPKLGSPKALDIPVKVDRWTVRLTRAEVIEETPGMPGTRILRVWVDPGPAKPYMLTNLAQLSVNDEMSSYCVRLDPDTGRILWFSVALPRGRSTVIGFGRVEAELAGPWQVTVPLTR